MSRNQTAEELQHQLSGRRRRIHRLKLRAEVGVRFR